MGLWGGWGSSVKRIMGWQPGGGQGSAQAGQRDESCRGGVSETVSRPKAPLYRRTDQALPVGRCHARALTEGMDKPQALPQSKQPLPGLALSALSQRLAAPPFGLCISTKARGKRHFPFSGQRLKSLM